MKHQILSDALNEIDDRNLNRVFRPARRILHLSSLAALLAIVILALSFAQPLALRASAIAQAPEPRISDRNQVSMDVWREERTHRSDATAAALNSLTPFFTDASIEFLSDTQNNTLWSPANAAIGLSMLAEVTDGSTQSQLMELLGTQDPQSLREQISALWESVYYQEGKEISTLANSLWLDKRLTYREEAINALSYHYYASIYRDDLGTARVNKAIGNWLNSNTGGLLKSAADSIELPKDAVLALYSTLFIQSKWTDEFNASKNTNAPFYAPSGTRTVTYMNRSLAQMNYYWGDTYGAISLSLKNGCRMWFILPDEGLSTTDVLQDGQYMHMLLTNSWDNTKYMKVNLSIPKFDVSQSRDLRPGLEKLGITEIFTLYDADFIAITSDTPVYITAANQAVRVQIDEQGVKAAAYIEFPGAGAAAPPEEIIDFILNRPFLFAITGDGVPLITGVVNEP